MRASMSCVKQGLCSVNRLLFQEEGKGAVGEPPEKWGKFYSGHQEEERKATSRKMEINYQATQKEGRKEHLPKAPNVAGGAGPAGTARVFGQKCLIGVFRFEYILGKTHGGGFTPRRKKNLYI